MKAAERLARRLESERNRNERFTARRKAEGKRQVMLWMDDAQIEALRQFQVAEGLPNRSDAVSALIERASKASAKEPTHDSD